MTERERDFEITFDVEDDEPGRRTDEKGLGEFERPASAKQLADELGRTDVRTTEEGYVEALVTDLEAIDDTTVRLVARLPTDREVGFRLEKPIPWSDEFLLTRIVEDRGYDAATVDHLVGERILLDRARTVDSDVPETAWAEDVRDRRHPYRDLLVSIGMPVRRRRDGSLEWRLVDPRERSEPATVGALSTSAKVGAAAGLYVLALLGLGAIGAFVYGMAIPTPLWITVLSWLVTLLFVGYVARVAVGAIARP